MQLTQEQKNFFHTFGFLSFPGLLNDRIDAIINAFEETWVKVGGGHNNQPHDGKKRSCINMYQTEYIASMLDDPRLMAIGKAFLGDDYNFMGGDGNYYVGDTGWHSDGFKKNGSMMHLKIAFYLDPLTKDTGCLRVIPGSHQAGDTFAEDLQRDLAKSSQIFGMAGKDIPAIALETKPGDVLVFNHNTKHASYGGGVRRRMFTMNLCQRYPEELMSEFLEYVSGAARFWASKPFHDAVLNGASPERMKHLEQQLNNFDHVVELSRKARETMLEPARG